jgi:hypothetical protein
MKDHAPNPAQASKDRPDILSACPWGTSIMRLSELERGCDPTTKSAIVADNVLF